MVTETKVSESQGFGDHPPSHCITHWCLLFVLIRQRLRATQLGWGPGLISGTPREGGRGFEIEQISRDPESRGLMILVMPSCTLAEAVLERRGSPSNSRALAAWYHAKASWLSS